MPVFSNSNMTDEQIEAAVVEILTAAAQEGGTTLDALSGAKHEAPLTLAEIKQAFSGPLAKRVEAAVHALVADETLSVDTGGSAVAHEWRFLITPQG